mmetsp:Transcript_462/g.1312  ORF Transcript_462/g.1312 Transcript_462/m.1312 type:complete len:216 (-) Transcript_462:220-867(-)
MTGTYSDYTRSSAGAGAPLLSSTAAASAAWPCARGSPIAARAPAQNPAAYQAAPAGGASSTAASRKATPPATSTAMFGIIVRTPSAKGAQGTATAQAPTATKRTSVSIAACGAGDTGVAVRSKCDGMRRPPADAARPARTPSARMASSAASSRTPPPQSAHAYTATHACAGCAVCGISSSAGTATAIPSDATTAMMESAGSTIGVVHRASAARRT